MCLPGIGIYGVNVIISGDLKHNNYFYSPPCIPRWQFSPSLSLSWRTFLSAFRNATSHIYLKQVMFTSTSNFYSTKPSLLQYLLSSASEFCASSNLHTGGDTQSKTPNSKNILYQSLCFSAQNWKKKQNLPVQTSARQPRNTETFFCSLTHI